MKRGMYMSTFQSKLEKYAELAIKVGVNIQPKQTLIIRTPIFAKEYVRLVVQKAYEAGAKNVHVEWSDDEITKTKYNMAPEEAFNEYPSWIADGYEKLAEEGAAFLSITGSDPDLLKGVEPTRIASANKAAGKALETFRSYMLSDQISWSIVAVPSHEWAQKVFPNDEK